MKDLDKSKRYSLEFLTEKEKEQVFNYLKENSKWEDLNINDFKDEYYKGIYFNYQYSLWIMTNSYLDTNAKELFEPEIPTLEEFTEKCETANKLLKSYEDKPKHYANGIDTFARMEANCTLDECLAFAKGNIDKYNFRTKGQDLEDFEKIIAYGNWAIKLLNKKENE